MIHRVRKSGPDAGKSAGWYCRPCTTRKVTAYRHREPDKVLDSKLWTFYRIRLADWHRMVAEQGGRCKACRRTPEGSNGVLGLGFVIDHDHRCCPSSNDRWGAHGTKRRICGKCIRGLLCQQCNVALGMVDDDPDRLRALLSYIESHQRTSSPASRSPRSSASM
jgi:hypothetical protein